MRKKILHQFCRFTLCVTRKHEIATIRKVSCFVSVEEMISIITPFYNEENTIISFIETVISSINDKNTIEEFILVNGESTDQSVKKIEERIKSYD
jgi:cellulose synthase/poly-beta-1,6-N-acetylglucosamine synthase-like glycosyltransferase